MKDISQNDSTFMFSTFKQRLMLGVYVFILLSIPVGAYLTSQRQTVKSSASEQKNAKPAIQVPPKPSTSPAKQLLSTSQTAVSDQKTSPSPSGESPTIATSFGPTLTFKVSLEGRPQGNQATKMFVGIAEGSLSSNPKFLLSFTVDLPASGEYSNLSLAGLTSGSQYTALLKSSAQIATSSVFTMSPTTTNLNNGEPINLISGDLNEDNVVNSADYSVAQKALGATPNSSNWNENTDFNKDGVINAFDLGFIIKHMGQTGDSGAWTSPIPKVATSSANLTQPSIGGPMGGTGHWIWVPSL
ncbi:MAG: dockerin type I domain-containing protein [Candidatus Daviesbacteria bacterium]|nr:dockerin type I domain-containing protein [Candidatus Daviesbacteria bacterium]